MSRLTILEFPDPRLRTRAEPVREVRCCAAATGRGHARDHVRRPRHRPGGHPGQRAPGAAGHGCEPGEEPAAGLHQSRNSERDGVEVSEEGCLSVPNIYEEVERAARVRVRAQACRWAAVFERDLEGVEAVCLQHEMDHLAGKLFVDYLSSLKRERIRRKLEKERRERASGGASAAGTRVRARHMTHAARRFCRYAGVCGAGAAGAGRLVPLAGRRTDPA